MERTNYPLTPANAASAYANPENLVGGHNAVQAPWQIQDRSSWGEREASYYEQIKQEREDNTAAILQYIQTTWNSWVQLVAAPQRYDYWRGQKISTRIRVTPMGLLPDQGIPPNVKFTSEITEFELDLVGIGVHWDLAQSNTQKFMTEASAVANLIASFEFTAKQAVISAVAQRTMNIAEIIAFFKAGQTVTLGAAMQLVNMIFGVANKGGSDLALLLNKIKEQTERRQTFLNTMLAPSTVIQAPAFINYWDLPRTGTQLRATPELAYKIQGWVENVFEVTGILMSNDKVSSGLSTQYHKGSWFLMKLSHSPKDDYISVTSGPDNSMKRLHVKSLIKNALNFDAQGNDMNPDLTFQLFGDLTDVLAGGSAAQAAPQAGAAVNLEIEDIGLAGLGLTLAEGSLFNLKEPDQKTQLAVILNEISAYSFRLMQTYVEENNLPPFIANAALNLSDPLDALVALMSYNFDFRGRIERDGPPKPVIARAQLQLTNAEIEENGPKARKSILKMGAALFVNLKNNTLSLATMEKLNRRVEQNAASNQQMNFTSLARGLKLRTPSLSKEMAILKASLTLNKLVDEKQLASLFSKNASLKSALNALRDMGVDQSHIDDHARICSSSAIQESCFGQREQKRFSAMTFGALTPRESEEEVEVVEEEGSEGGQNPPSAPSHKVQLTRQKLLELIESNNKNAHKKFQILVGRQFQEGEGTSVALLEPGGKAVKLYIGQPTFGSGFNSANMMAQATLRMMMGVAVTPTGIATLPHVHLTDFNPKTFGTDFIDPEKLRQENGFVQAADGRLGALWSFIIPADIEIPPVWTIKGTFDIPQLEGASIEQNHVVPNWLQYLKFCMNYESQTGLDAMKIDPEAKVINEIMERGVWNIGDNATVNPCDAFGLALSGANSNQYKSGGYANGVNTENAGYYHLAAVQ